MRLRFIVDENLPNSIANLLRTQGHDVISVRELYRGYEDKDIIQISQDEERVILTRDKDFGLLIYRNHLLPFALILLRLDEPTKENLENTTLNLLKLIERQKLIVKNRIIVFDGISLRSRAF